MTTAPQVQTIQGPHGMTSRFNWTLYGQWCEANGIPPKGRK